MIENGSLYPLSFSAYPDRRVVGDRRLPQLTLNEVRVCPHIHTCGILSYTNQTILPVFGLYNDVGVPRAEHADDARLLPAKLKNSSVRIRAYQPSFF